MERYEPFQLKIQQDGRASFVLEQWEREDASLSVGFSSRAGGVSDIPYFSLNCGRHVGDRAEHVVENRRIVSKLARFSFDAWTCAEQVHGNRVERIGSGQRGKGRFSREDAVQNADALVTNEQDIMLVSFYADCVPLYFYAPDVVAIGLAHAGWKGTVLDIASRTIDVLERDYGADRKRLLVAIGPSIGPCCYEVDERVAEQIYALTESGKLSMDEHDMPFGLTAKENGHYDLDLKEVNRQIMIKAGVEPQHLQVSAWCTGCQREWFYSHRMEGGRTGRMVAWIGFNSEEVT